MRFDAQQRSNLSEPLRVLCLELLAIDPCKRGVSERKDARQQPQQHEPLRSRESQQLQLFERSRPHRRITLRRSSGIAHTARRVRVLAGVSEQAVLLPLGGRRTSEQLVERVVVALAVAMTHDATLLEQEHRVGALCDLAVLVKVQRAPLAKARAVVVVHRLRVAKCLEKHARSQRRTRIETRLLRFGTYCKQALNEQLRCLRLAGSTLSANEDSLRSGTFLSTRHHSVICRVCHPE
eukprot:3953734-Prymnesium_polylepis.1